jgi:hypothetical protein
LFELGSDHIGSKIAVGLDICEPKQMTFFQKVHSSCVLAIFNIKSSPESEGPPRFVDSHSLGEEHTSLGKEEGGRTF